MTCRATFTESLLCQACVGASHTLIKSFDKHWLTTHCGQGLGPNAEDADVNGEMT